MIYYKNCISGDEFFRREMRFVMDVFVQLYILYGRDGVLYCISAYNKVKYKKRKKISWMRFTIILFDGMKFKTRNIFRNHDSFDRLFSVGDLILEAFGGVVVWAKDSSMRSRIWGITNRDWFEIFVFNYTR